MRIHTCYSKATPEQRDSIERVLAKMEGESCNMGGVESGSGPALSRSSSLCTLACSEDGWPTVVPSHILEEVERMLAAPPVLAVAAAPKVPAIQHPPARPAESTAIVPVCVGERPAFMTAEDDALLEALEGHRPVHPGAKMQHRIASGLPDPRGDPGDEPARKALRPAAKTRDSGKQDCVFWPLNRFWCVCACVHVYIFERCLYFLRGVVSVCKWMYSGVYILMCA